LLRHSVGRFTSRTGLVATALVITLPWTYIFITHGAFYGNLLQLWFGIWMMPQQIQMALALSKSEVDHLPFFAGEEPESLPTDLSTVSQSALVKAQAYGKLEEKPWNVPETPAQQTPIPLATAAPISQKVTMKVNSSMKLPPGTYTIEDAVA
jgi:hypothetical protein